LLTATSYFIRLTYSNFIPEPYYNILLILLIPKSMANILQIYLEFIIEYYYFIYSFAISLESEIYNVEKIMKKYKI